MIPLNILKEFYMSFFTKIKQFFMGKPAVTLAERIDPVMDHTDRKEAITQVAATISAITPAPEPAKVTVEPAPEPVVSKVEPVTKPKAARKPKAKDPAEPWPFPMTPPAEGRQKPAAITAAKKPAQPKTPRAPRAPRTKK
jgi:hypothetical protein